MNQTQVLRRARADSIDMPAPWIGGVASGLAARSQVSVAAVRTGFVAASLLGGVGFFAYAWLWLVTPLAGEGDPARDAVEAGPLRSPLPQVGVRRDRQKLVGQLVVAGLAFLIGALVLAGLGARGVASLGLLPGLLMAIAGPVLTWLQAPKFSEEKNAEALGYVLLGLGLAVGGVISLLAQTEIIPGVRVGVTVGAAIIVALIVALVPLGTRVTEDMAKAREQTARETERALIAAHLHDSVLQTLAMVRTRADDPKAVQALALAQERELRSWLYGERLEQETSAAEALRNQMSQVESSFGVPIEVVTVGDLVPNDNHLAAVAAAGEAATNAAKHGEPPISVYQEARAGALEIFVKDAGDGFDVGRIPADRHGYTGSIVRRVETAGGEATVRFLPPPEGSGRRFGGTEIRIVIPTEE